MIPTRLLSHTVDLIRLWPSGADLRYNTPTITESSRETVQGRMEKQAGLEDPDRPGVVVNQWRLIVNDPGYELTSIDRVEWDGSTFNVLGTPQKHYTPRGVHHHEYDLEEVIV